MKTNNKFTLFLITILVLAFSVFFCCCGIDTTTAAGSASQINQQKENDNEIIDEYYDEDPDIDDEDDLSESDDLDLDELDDDEDAKDEEDQVFTYVLNTNTDKFHYPDCRSVKQMKDKNKQVVEVTREEIIERGFSPCGNCNP